MGRHHNDPRERKDLSPVIGNIIAAIVIGIIAGYLGRALLPGKDSMGFVATVLVGIVGALVAQVPGVQLPPALAQGVLAALLRPGDEAVERDRHVARGVGHVT